MNNVFVKSLALFFFFISFLLIVIFWGIEILYPHARIDNLLFHVYLATDLSMLKFDILKDVLEYWLIASACLLGGIWLLVRTMPVKISLFISIAFCLGMSSFMGYRYGLFHYLYLMTMGYDFYAKEYVFPEQTKIHAPLQKPNLILLYLESLETTYQNNEIFKDNLLPELTKIAQNNQSWSQYRITTGTGWTVAAMVSSSCGIGLNLLGERNINVGEKNFLPNITCLQDILHKNGYKQELLLGSEKDFSGIEYFIGNRADGKIKIVDGQYFIDKYGKNGNRWGGIDSMLYQKAKEDLSDLAKTSQPFAMSIFTIDTHQPEGWLDEQCPSKYGDFRDIVICADTMAADFIKWIDKQPWRKNTVIFVIGDHIAITNPIYHEYLAPNLDKRYIYNAVIGSALPLVDKERQFTAIDMLPTILEGMGYKIDGHRLGLGRSLYAGKDLPTLVESYGTQKLDEVLMYSSDIYKGFVNKK